MDLIFITEKSMRTGIFTNKENKEPKAMEKKRPRKESARKAANKGAKLEAANQKKIVFAALGTFIL